MDKRLTLKLIAASAVLAAAAAPFGAAHAQTKLKWAHVYETSEPFHKWSVWAGDEIKKRTNGKYEVQVFPASSLGKESDINQGLTLGTVDIILTGASFAASSYKPLAISYFPFIFRDAEHQRVVAVGGRLLARRKQLGGDRPAHHEFDRGRQCIAKCGRRGHPRVIVVQDHDPGDGGRLPCR